MPVEPELRTSRLILRPWRDADRAPFAALNADPVVMEHFRAPLRGEESDALADRIAADIDERGWGLWAVEIPGTAAFCGFIGSQPGDVRRVHACRRGRLAHGTLHWGSGYATEGATAALSFGFDALALEEIVSFTTHGNARSRWVMERLGIASRSRRRDRQPQRPRR
jgi:RimJ/RimL family protein N-acetyltransferase